jgi:acetyltransferase-like isoleucine patch superfamily enzyme
MFSDEVLIQTSDQHGIVDLGSGAIINDVRKETTLGDHVWLGRRSLLMANVTIGSGTIVGAAAIVTSDIPAHSIAVGSPARIIREQVTWTRKQSALDDYASAAIAVSQG